MPSCWPHGAVRFGMPALTSIGARMPRRIRQWTSPAPTPLPAALATATCFLTDAQISRWADLIADGRDSIPNDLPAAEREQLVNAVRRQLRGRFVQLVARAIATRLHGHARDGDSNNARTKV